MPRPSAFAFPDGKQFAFTVMDDTDVATVQNVAPVYAALERLGMRATKTVWAVPCPEGSQNYCSSQTLADSEYEAFVVSLSKAGFEVAFHGATMESSSRERTMAGLERFRAVVGDYPRVHANHALNRENLYWGPARVDSSVLKRVLGRLHDTTPDYYQGHVEDSTYWWGDLCARHIQYVRNLTFSEVNVLRVNPSMPYKDPSRPLVPWWFSASDAEDAEAFCRLISSTRQRQLERERGVCIVATHFGKGFVRGGRVLPEVTERLEMLAARPGWFPTVGALLDWMLAQRQDVGLPAREWRRMQRRWARDLVLRKGRELLQRHVLDRCRGRMPAESKRTVAGGCPS